MHGLLNDIAITVIFAAILGVFSHILRQPLLLALVASGVIIGPKLGLGLVQSGESIEVIAELGLILLLFIVGLETNLHELRKSGKGLLLAGLGQFPTCVVLGFGAFALLNGLGAVELGSNLQILYLALMSALSSTAIVVKLLYDQKDLTTQSGQLTLGVLVFQDLYAILVLALQPNFANPTFFPILHALASSVLLVGTVYLFSRYVLAGLFRFVAMSPEIVISVSLGWCAVCAASAELLGLSKEMGALLAGAGISAFPYSTHVSARILPLRDFFLTLAFVALGMKIEAPTMSMILPIISISAVVVASRFLSVFPLVLASKAGARTAFVASVNLAQMSEFSLVIAAIAFESGHIPASMMSLVVYTMVGLAVVSSHAIARKHRLFRIFEARVLKPRGWAVEPEEIRAGSHRSEFVILGFHRGARAFLNAVREGKPELLERILVIDFNPRTIERLKQEGINCVFGDVGNFEALRHVGLTSSRIVVSIVPDMLLRGTSNRAVVRMVRVLAPGAIIVATGDDEDHAQELLREGAQIVLQPFDLAGKEMISSLNQLLNSGEALKLGGVTETLAFRWTWKHEEPEKGAGQL